MNPDLPFRQPELEQIFQANFPNKRNCETVPPSVETDNREWSQQDKDLCVQIYNSKQGQLFRQLFEGDISYHGSQSEADLALCNILAFWTGKDSCQMDRIVRASGLYRPKWDKRHGSKTYGEMTISKALADCLEAYKAGQSQAVATAPEPIDPISILSGYEVEKEYVDGLGKEVFLYANLIIQQHVVTIIAKSGSGKTTFFYFVVAPELARKGLTVLYIDADSPASDHKKMKAIADEWSFRFINPDTRQGNSIDSLIKHLRQIADAHSDLSDWVLFFDTLKKATDLMSKRSVKEFYQLVRKLANLGATVILLGHANKYPDSDGNMIFEGTGDVKSDSDELIFFESKKNDSGGIDVTTVVDIDKGAKVRGLFEPFSFHISKAREVSFYDQVLDFNKESTGPQKATDEEILEAAVEYLKQVGEPLKQQPLAQYVADITNTGINRVRQIISKNAPIKDGTQGEDELVVSVGKNNARLYELATTEGGEEISTSSTEGGTQMSLTDSVLQ